MYTATSEIDREGSTLSAATTVQVSGLTRPGAPVEVVTTPALSLRISGKPLPYALLEKYRAEAMKLALTRQLEDSGRRFAEIPSFVGLWGEGDSEEAAHGDLSGALEDWLLLKIERSDRDIPEISGINLNVL